MPDTATPRRTRTPLKVIGQAAPLLEVASLRKRYGDQFALADVSFSVRAGEILGLIGPNGAGKTTLMEAIAGVIPADTGGGSWQGTPLSNASRREVMFYLPDGLRPWAEQYVQQVVSFFADVYRRSESDLAATLAAVGLVPALGKRVFALSKGYARRLMLALALLTPQPLLLMDEPFDGFDLRQTREMAAVLRRLAAEGRTLVVAIHQLSDAERVCDRFVLLAEGRVRGIGTLDELRVETKCGSGSLEDVFLALA